MVACALTHMLRGRRSHIRSFETRHLGASLAVVDVGSNRHHATSGDIVRRCHLDRASAPHAADDLDGNWAGLHALSVRKVAV